MSSPAWTTPLVMAASALLTPLLMRAASRAFPPRRAAIASYDVLRPRYKPLELWSQLFAAIGGVGALCFLLFFRPSNTPWLVGVIFGWLVLVPLLFIAVCTLPRGKVHTAINKSGTRTSQPKMTPTNHGVLLGRKKRRKQRAPTPPIAAKSCDQSSRGL